MRLCIGKNLRTTTVVLAAAFCLQLAPGGLRAQQPDFDAWRADFMARLDDGLERIQADERNTRRKGLTLTWGSPNDNPNPLRMSKTSVLFEKGDQGAMIASVLQEQGLPTGLTSVVVVESAFNPLAISPKGARGLWQLMPETARRYGLKVEPHEDERTNPLKSTNAAAAYIKDLYTQFRDWPLVLAAYNAGEDRVARAMARTGARDFWSLRRHAALPEETLQYVPAVLTKLEGPLPTPQFQIAGSADPNGENGSNEGRVAYALPTAIRN